MASTDDKIPSLSELERRYHGNPAPLVDFVALDEVLASSAIDEENVKDKKTDRKLRIGMASPPHVKKLPKKQSIQQLLFAD